jgi:hypothetical protein
MDEAKHQRDQRTEGNPVPAVRGGMRVTADADSTPPEIVAPSPSPNEHVAMQPEQGDEQMGHQEQEESGDTDMGYVGSLEPAFDDFVSEMLLMSLASSGRKYGRETRAAHRRIVSEVYSPPRVTAEIKKGRHPHLVPGFAFDLTVCDPDDGQPWDFSVKAKREKARTQFNRQKPYMLIGSPACTAFSTWMALNEARSKDVAAVRRAKIRAILHIDFVIELYYDQLADGRYFLHEHPEHATSWQLTQMKNLMEAEGVIRVCGDQCQFGAEHQRGARRGDPVKKPTGFLTNSRRVAEALDVRCQGRGGACSRAKGGQHAPCAG